MAHYPADTFQEAVELSITASNQLHQILNGDSTTEVTVEDGSKIPSVRKAMVDSLYFKPPIAWAQGEYEDTYNQLREFVDGDVRTWWFAKGATVSTPVLMTTNPAIDVNWTLWSAVTLNAATYETQKRLAAEAGLNMVGSFLLGAIVTTTDDVVFYETDGKYYGWGGTLPKTVPAGSTPATSGGIGAGAWVDRTDVTLRSELIMAPLAVRDGAYALRDTVSAKDFGAKGDGVSDDFNALQLAINYVTTGGGALYIPAGTYNIGSGLMVSPSTGKSVSIVGDGLGLSVIKQSINGFKILTVASGFNWPSTSIKISKLGLRGLDKTNVENVGFYLGTPGGAALDIDNVGVSGCYCGFDLCGAQFSKYSHLTSTGNVVGLHLYTSSSSQGGNNNHFSNYYALGNTVGLLITNGGSGELQSNIFDNLVTHANMCGVAVFGKTGVLSLSAWAPEQNGGTADWPNATTTVYGKTIRRCAGHFDSTSVSLKGGFIFTTTTPSQYLQTSGVVYAENGTILNLDAQSSSNANILPDESSTFSYISPSSFYGVQRIGERAITSGNKNIVLTGNSGSFISEDYKDFDSTVVNAAAAYGNVCTGYASGTATISTIKDIIFGQVTQLTIASGQFASVNICPAISPVGTSVIAAFNVKATSSGRFTFNLGQATASITTTLVGGIWYRIVLFGTSSFDPRTGNILIQAADSSGESNPLSICKIMARVNPTAYEKRQIASNGFNPADFSATPEGKASSYPTTGSWKAGDIMYNSAPSSGAYIGWICTVSGVPGTWKGFGLIA